MSASSLVVRTMECVTSGRVSLFVVQVLVPLSTSQERADGSNTTALDGLYAPLLQKWREDMGASHPDTAHTLNKLAVFYRTQGKYAKAELLYRRALTISQQRLLGPEHPTTQTIQRIYTVLLEIMKRDEEAEP